MEYRVAMALGFVHSRPFVTSSIIGATSLDQLRADIEGGPVTLPAEATAGIKAIHGAYPDPCP